MHRDGRYGPCRSLSPPFAKQDNYKRCGTRCQVKQLNANAECIEALDKAAAGAREAFEKASDEHLMKNWQLKAGGNVVAEAPRYEMIQDSLLHLAHHRGQMTVYLRLMGAKVPAIYRPSADDKEFR